MMLGGDVSRVGEVMVDRGFFEYSFGRSCWIFWREIARAECRMSLKEVAGVEMEGVQSLGVAQIFERDITEEV